MAASAAGRRRKAPPLRWSARCQHLDGSRHRFRTPAARANASAASVPKPTVIGRTTMSRGVRCCGRDVVQAIEGHVISQGHIGVLEPACRVRSKSEQFVRGGLNSSLQCAPANLEAVSSSTRRVKKGPGPAPTVRQTWTIHETALADGASEPPPRRSVSHRPDITEPAVTRSTGTAERSRPSTRPCSRNNRDACASSVGGLPTASARSQTHKSGS